MYNYTSIKVPKFQSFLGPVKDPPMPPSQRSYGDWRHLTLVTHSRTYHTLILDTGIGHCDRDTIWDILIGILYGTVKDLAQRSSKDLLNSSSMIIT